jgi:hypothetical protein
MMSLSQTIFSPNGEAIKVSTDAFIKGLCSFVDMYENASMEQLSEEEKQCSQLTLHLTQEETLGFHFYPAAKKNIAVIHIRILTTDGEAYASEPIRERIFGTRRDGVIGEENPNA